MVNALPPSLALTLAALAGPAAGNQDHSQVRTAQVIIRQRIIIRVPRVGPAPLLVGRTAIPAPVVWREGKGPKCIATDRMAGAAIGRDPAGGSGADATTVDLVMTGGVRLRARLDGDCAPLDFYSGFYFRATGDGKVCAGRDAIRVRSGASCPIARFRTLTARR